MEVGGTEYLFIDGRYFRSVVQRTLEPLFGTAPEIDFKQVKFAFGAAKAFYYDCIDDIQKPNEDRAAFELRVKRQSDVLNAIRSLAGFHVRLGTLSGEGKKLRQKEVDVQLAVDMLGHAFSKNMGRATLVAGDLDFRPVVNSLIQLGTYVRVCYSKSHAAAEELRWSADESAVLGIDVLHQWTTTAFKTSCPLPHREGFSEATLILGEEIRTGNLNGAPVRLFLRDQPSRFYLVINRDSQAVQISHRDREFLYKYVDLTEGTVWWNS